ncbi:PepSY domain-containing protein [Paenibacillus sp. GCM10027626]|uniref:PepSY domain-containing protein n=1 Tax=Paenibacillus sp. GCM10027626 TaxID=3273411 RepID=UPI00363CE24F
MGEEKAKQLALVAVQGQIKSMEIERGHGVRYYEVELETDKGEVEVDVDVDAYNGKILSVNYD